MPDRLLLACALLGPLGCRSAATGPAPSPATEAASAEPTAAPGVGTPEAQHREDTRPRIERGESCAPGSTTIAGAGLCLKIPDAYTAAAPLPGVQHFEAPDAPPITVRWLPASRSFGKTHADAVGRLSALDSGALEGPTRDGAGIFVFALETQPQAHVVGHAASSVRVGDDVAWCTASAPVRASVPRAFFEACQSLMTSAAR